MKRITTALLATVVGAGLMSSAYAADLIVEEPAEVGVVDVSGNWDGVYVGAFAGYGWGTLTEEDGIFAPAGTEFDLTGWEVGVTAGVNFTVSEAIVAGLAGDLAWSNVGNGDNVFGYDSSNINWRGSIRGRLGFDGGSFLPYVTAGLAFANATVDTTFPSSDSQTHIGWTAGVGVEFAVADNVSLDLQYRYTDYGSVTYDAPFPTDVSLTTSAVTAGVNFRF